LTRDSAKRKISVLRLAHSKIRPHAQPYSDKALGQAWLKPEAAACMAVPRMTAGVAVHENINPDLLPGMALRVGLPVMGTWWRRYTGTGH
jgi:hypothetical protein